MIEPRLPKILVPAGMVEMPVGVDHESDRVGIEGRDRSGDLVAERSELVVDDDVSVLPVGKADIAARFEQDGDAWSQPLHLDLHLAVILLGRSRSSEESKSCKSEECAAHSFPLKDQIRPASGLDGSA